MNWGWGVGACSGYVILYITCNRAVAEVQQRPRVVVEYSLEEACCVGYAGTPPNCTGQL